MNTTLHRTIFFIALAAAFTPAIAQKSTKSSPETTLLVEAAEAVPTPVPVEVVSCKNPAATPLSRFWELEPASDCGTFGLRGYRPMSLAVVGSDSVNTAPSSPSSGHTGSFQAYTTSETRINLSVRTKIAQGLLTGGDPNRLDSLWFAYSQQSYWQLFNAELSRPFRATDHEPELIYIFPVSAPLPSGGRLRYGGIAVNHQSNGQSLPLSRSWNRIIARAGMEWGDKVSLTGALWQRIPEDSASDDNPDIVDRVGRAELSAVWNVDPRNALALTVRHSLQSGDSGSARLAWFKKLGNASDNGGRSSLRLHTELFSGYGDSLMDYNRQRTVFSVGLTLLDW
jgi:phospholipase A1